MGKFLHRFLSLKHSMLLHAGTAGIEEPIDAAVECLGLIK